MNASRDSSRRAVSDALCCSELSRSSSRELSLQRRFVSQLQLPLRQSDQPGGSAAAAMVRPHDARPRVRCEPHEQDWWRGGEYVHHEVSVKGVAFSVLVDALGSGWAHGEPCASGTQQDPADSARAAVAQQGPNLVAVSDPSRTTQKGDSIAGAI